MILPKQVKWLLKQFENHNYECFLVGGCVRDELLKRPVHDYDFTTNATPKEMMDFLSHTDCSILPSGMKHGTLTIHYQNMAMEVTTYRMEAAYEHHRYPKSVTFSDDIICDLSRRDFTINAMAYHPKIGLIDPFSGKQDLAQGIIRCVGNAQERFDEDALRILRALRFSFQLQFSLDSACQKAIKEKASLLTCISKERIRDEWNAMLQSDQLFLLTKLREYGVLSYIFPVLKQIYDLSQESKWHRYDVFTHTDIALNHTKGLSLCEKLAIVLHDVGKAETKTYDALHQAHFYGHPAKSAQLAKEALMELKYPKKTIERVSAIIAYHDYYVTPSKKVLRRFLAHIHMDYELAYAILRVQEADDYAKELTLSQDKIHTIHTCRDLLKEMQDTEGMLKRSDLHINGHDLISLGYQGKQIGEILQWLYQKVIDHPDLNDKEALIALAHSYKKL